MPILGVVASSARVQAGSYEWIASATGTGSNQVLNFSSIPSTYKHLQIRANLTTSGLGGSSQYGGWITFNGDTTSSYGDHSMYGTGSNPMVAYNVVPRANMGLITYSTNNGITSTNILDILEYSNTNKAKTVKSLQTSDMYSFGGGIVNYGTGMWNNTTTVSSISLFLNAGFGAHYFTTNATAHLYGIKG
jgi:hypothetical protein